MQETEQLEPVAVYDQCNKCSQRTKTLTCQSCKWEDICSQCDLSDHPGHNLRWITPQAKHQLSQATAHREDAGQLEDRAKYVERQSKANIDTFDIGKDKFKSKCCHMIEHIRSQLKWLKDQIEKCEHPKLNTPACQMKKLNENSVKLFTEACKLRGHCEYWIKYYSEEKKTEIPKPDAVKEVMRSPSWLYQLLADERKLEQERIDCRDQVINIELVQLENLDFVDWIQSELDTLCMRYKNELHESTKTAFR